MQNEFTFKMASLSLFLNILRGGGISYLDLLYAEFRLDGCAGGRRDVPVKSQV